MAAATAGAQRYTMDEVAKHRTGTDCWVVIRGRVFDVTSFMSIHPGGHRPLLLYGGRDATEEFEMLHDPKVLAQYSSNGLQLLGAVAPTSML
eukprot:NODE_28182_length_486_cov_4.125348.p3 GENE.NODE_28182_length_486_cov_4.125348~~NODE_28182_length_486_cov_4.125348.p3  ORF type:complete len:92 (-),score=26.38 NODE_28182_length_486_cov_4.125348:114-389(-)